MPSGRFVGEAEPVAGGLDDGVGVGVGVGVGLLVPVAASVAVELDPVAGSAAGSDPPPHPASTLPPRSSPASSNDVRRTWRG